MGNFWDQNHVDDDYSDPMQTGVEGSDMYVPEYQQQQVNMQRQPQVINTRLQQQQQQQAQYQQPQVTMSQLPVTNNMDQSGFDLNECEGTTVNKAILRLEQGRLYQMLIEHNFFDSVPALPEAVSVVQNELKGFIIERLEILLGLREEGQGSTGSSELPFNSLEISALKQVAYTITKGKSSKVEPINELKGSINPIKPSPVVGLNKISASKSLPVNIPNTTNELPKTGNMKVKKSSNMSQTQPQAPQTQVLQPPRDNKPSKPISRMNEDELIARNAKIPKAKKAVSNRSLPQPDSHQMETFFQNRGPVLGEKTMNLMKVIEIAAKNKNQSGK
jgi:hypothetical protein